jgi:hypothetical protein
MASKNDQKLAALIARRRDLDRELTEAVPARARKRNKNRAKMKKNSRKRNR